MSVSLLADTHAVDQGDEKSYKTEYKDYNSDVPSNHQYSYAVKMKYCYQITGGSVS